MPEYPMVALVVPVHNGIEDTLEFLESLREVTYPRYRVIIVDDGSTDGTSAAVTRAYPEVVLLGGDGNLWWSASMNLGIRKAQELGADYVLLGDNDVRVHPEFLSELVGTAERNPRSLVTSKVYLYHDPETILEAGWEVDWLKGGFRAIGSDEIDRGQYDEEHDVKSGSTGVLVRTAYFADVGLFDEKCFPLYWADVDLLYRAYKKGYRIIYQPKSRIWHKLFSTVKKSTPAPHSFWATFVYLTSNRRSALNIRQVMRFWARHCPWYLIPYIVLRYSALVLRKSKRHNILRMKMPKHVVPAGKAPR